MKKKINVVICAFSMLVFSMLITPMTFIQNTVIASEVETRADIKEWRYKVIDGHLYKRLFNASTGRWETDWILVQ